MNARCIPIVERNLFRYRNCHDGLSHVSRKHPSQFLIAALFLLPWLVVSQRATAGQPDFNRDIREILSDRCYSCHGPDAETRKAGLRLDSRQSAIEAGVLLPEQLDQSSFLERITSTDPEVVMPPPGTVESLSSDQIEKLRAWVLSGAKYEEHWAYVAPRRPEVPDIKHAGTNESSPRLNNPIDHFVIERLSGSTLGQSPPADRATLVRRLYLDLIGLPPSPEDLQRWASLETDDWSKEVVQELLAREHFGERWARWWLDAARYTDSDGYEKDKPREVWFYRDWVIQAMNHDMPYDQFIIKQIAGDLLPGATQDDHVATGYLRNSMVNEEGGADPEQFRVEGLFDRMDAIGKSVLGITTQCAQCHSHKFDPLTQEEYYAMFAALNNCHEAMITVYTPDQQRKREEVMSEIAKIQSTLRETHTDWRERLTEWHAETGQAQPTWQTLTPTELPWEGQKFRPLEDGSLISESYAPTRNDISFPCKLEPGTYTAVQLELLTHPQLPHGGPGRSFYGTGALTDFEVSVTSPEDASKKLGVKFKRAVADVNPPTVPLPAIYRDRDPTKDERITGSIEMAIDGDAKTAWSTDNGPGRRNQDRKAIFEFEQPLVVTEPTTIWFRMLQNHGGWNSDDNQNYLLGRYRFSITEDARPTDNFVPATIQPLLARSFESLNNDEVSQLFDVWRLSQESMSEANSQIETLWQQHPFGSSQLTVIECEKPRETFVMLRGDFLKPGSRSEPGVPKFLHASVSSNAPPRLQLARWLADRDSPTTARAIVNRIWQAYFGRALVTTPEDLGHQSPAPSHPKLLDWLAVELMDSGWSLKHIHQLIVHSATYQQSSVATPEHLAVDRYNELLARGPRFRLDAEVIRDLGLSVSGLLNDKVGGPSVYPPAPEFLFEPPTSYGPKIWNQTPSAEQYRRSIYVHRFRSVPYPVLQVFDAPKGDQACVRRERSNNPLQALVMLNEPQFVEIARALATRILRESRGDNDTNRLHYAHELVTGRGPTQEEIAVLLKLLEQQRSRLADGSLKAEALVGTDGQPTHQLTGHSADELLPWIVVARVLLNLDETITKG